MILIKLVCFFKLFLNQRLEAFCQLFSWTSVGLSGCLIDQMIRSQSNLRVWVYPGVQHYIIQKLCQSYLRTPSQKLFWKSLKFKMSHCKNFQCTLSKICLYHQTVIDQRPLSFTNCSVGLQLDPPNLQSTKLLVRKAIWGSKHMPDFSWTLELSDWQNDRFARPSESLRNSLNTMCTIWELLHKNFFESD